MLCTVSRMLILENILKDYEIYEFRESTDHWMIELREKENQIPPELQKAKNVVFDGYFISYD